MSGGSETWSGLVGGFYFVGLWAGRQRLRGRKEQEFWGSGELFGESCLWVVYCKHL